MRRRDRQREPPAVVVRNPEEIEQVLSAMPGETGWVMVGDRLPTEHEVVFVVCSDPEDWSLAWRVGDKWCRIDDDGGVVEVSPRAWHPPLPPAPAAQEEPSDG